MTLVGPLTLILSPVSGGEGVALFRLARAAQPV